MTTISFQKQSVGADAIFCAPADASKFQSRDDGTIELVPSDGVEDFTTDVLTAGTWENGYRTDWSYDGAEDIIKTTTAAEGSCLWTDTGKRKTGEQYIYARVSNGSGSRCAPIMAASISRRAYVEFRVNNSNDTIEIIEVLEGIIASRSGSESKSQSDDTYYWAKCYINFDTLAAKMKFWGGAIGDEPAGWDIEHTLNSLEGGYVGMQSYTTTKCSDFRVSNGSYPSTSPVYYARYDLGADDASVTSEAQKILTNLASTDTGNVKVKFGFSNTSYGSGDTATIDALLSDTWLTPDGSNEVTNPGGTGRYMYIAYQFNSDGTQQTSAMLMSDDAVTVEVGSGDSTPPGTASATVNAAIDGTTARFTLSAVPSDSDLNEIRVQYAEKSAGTWSRSSAFAANTVGQTLDLTLTEGARYIAQLVSIDNSGNETVHQALEFTLRNPSAGAWSEVDDSVDPGWTEET